MLPARPWRTASPRGTARDGRRWAQGYSTARGGAGSVKAIVVSGSNLYAGGAFAKAGSVLTSGIARWNGASWSALPVGGNGAQSQFQFVRATVNALALSGSTLYAGGDFASISGVPASGVAAWNGTTWRAFGAGISVGGGRAVQALAVFAGKLFAGGTFTDAGGQAGIAQWNGSAWSAVGAGLTGSVNAFAVSPGGVVVGGLFGGSGTTMLNSIGMWTGGAWTGFGLGASSGPGSGYLTTLAAGGRDLYAGGVFSTAGPTPVSNLAHFNGSRWDAMGGGVTGGTPFAVAINGSQVYIGGSFSQAGTGAASHIAMWNGSAWARAGKRHRRGGEGAAGLQRKAVGRRDLRTCRLETRKQRCDLEPDHPPVGASRRERRLRRVLPACQRARRDHRSRQSREQSLRVHRRGFREHHRRHHAYRRKQLGRVRHNRGDHRALLRLLHASRNRGRLSRRDPRVAAQPASLRCTPMA